MPSPSDLTTPSTTPSCELGDDEMLTLIRMAGWDVGVVADYSHYLIAPDGAALVVTYIPHQSQVTSLFNEFLRFKEHQ